MKKLLSIFGSLGMAGITGASVVACGDPKETKTTPKEDLNKRIKEVENAQKVIDDNDNWGGIAESVKNKLEGSIERAKEVAGNPEATDEDVNNSIEDLSQAIADYELSLPENIITTIINEKEDIKGIVEKDWTYSQFWNLEGEEPGGRIMDIFYGAVRNKSIELGYNEEDATTLHNEVLKWSEKNVNLVYINLENGKQVIKNTISRDGNEQKTMEEIFLEEVKEDFPDGDLSNPDFWKENNRLSLGISFAKDADGHKLADGTKDFWTFTFITE